MIIRPFLASLVLVGCAGSTVLHAADAPPAVGHWSFEGDLADRSGRGNDGVVISGKLPDLVAARQGRGLPCGLAEVAVPDTPELRLAPGLTLDCWARVDAPGPSWQELLIKDGAYQLRLDPQSEGGRFSFFVNTDGWEPRVQAKTVPQLGTWHHLRAGWTGEEIWIDVDDQRSSVPRKGKPGLATEPLELGKFQGVLDELRIENPQASHADAAGWSFDGEVRDASGHRHDLSGAILGFVPSPGGQALRLDGKPLTTASAPDLQLAPGFRIDCAVRFDSIPKDGAMILMKDGEYQLRVDPAAEGSHFSFFTHLGGWEPRVQSDSKLEPGQWYRLSARWDGLRLTLDVNGVRHQASRTGLPVPTNHPLQVGPLPGLLDRLRIENPRLPSLQVTPARQEHAILSVDREEKFTSIFRNIGAPAKDVVVRIEATAGIRNLGQSVHHVGEMPTGSEREIRWSVQADAPLLGAARIEVLTENGSPLRTGHELVFFTSEDALPPTDSKTPVDPPGVAANESAWYIDSVNGNNAHVGTTSETAWKDFSPVNGRTLGPGARLLIRRGSVINQELAISARGTADHWATIGTYGEGPRPILRRNGDIDDRCALVRDPDFLRITGLVVCHAGKGLVVHYTKPGHRGLVIDDCIAHHIEGLYRHNSHGIPEWLDRNGAPGDGLSVSAGLAISGAPASDLTMRDCEVFQNSSGFFVQGNDVLVERVFCHDNVAHNTSPHPFLVGIRRAVLRDSIFDASGWHASAGTMGIMLGNPQGLVIRNCYFSNQPDSGSHDEGGIDFENSGNGCLIDRCTFLNNAGAAIEMLGLKAPQTTNVEIRNSRFLQNNTAKKLGPAEIYLWGKVRDPAVCCSTGLIQGNGYVTLPGVEFIVNEAPDLMAWVARNNTGFAAVAELERAMPFNRPPVVSAGPVLRTDQRTVVLKGAATDDARPAGGRLTTRWEAVAGPGHVSFDDAGKAETRATFGTPGDYTLRLVAGDGEFWRSAWAVVHVLPEGGSVRAAWEFNTNLDKEGWSEENPGTTIRQWPNREWSTTSHPVKLVTGGNFVLAIEHSREARLLSPDRLGLTLTEHDKVTIRFQNHTPAQRMRFRFVTDVDSSWDDAKSRVFAVQPNDPDCGTYVIDLSTVPSWKGTLRQMRFDLADGTPLTGTCRFDYVWIGSK